MNGANHKLSGISTYPFQIFGNGWEKVMPEPAELPYKGDTVVGNDVWIGYEALIMPGVKIGNGAIVSSRSALRQRARNGAYAVSKAALITLAEAIAEEYGGRGVRANVVVPGTIDTEANRRAMPDADPAGWTPPGQVARVIAYLSSSAADGMNGKVVEVGGGTLP